jgi:hypothetical protein
VGGEASNVPVTDKSVVIATTQLSFPAQEPLQPENVEPVSADAESETVLP